MDMIGGSNKEMELPASADGLSRRNVLVTATVAAGALAGVPVALADTVPAASFGAPRWSCMSPRACSRSSNAAP